MVRRQTGVGSFRGFLLIMHREPLCKFIGKPVPNTPFPNGNIASEFGPKLMTVDGERFRRARRNAVKVGAVFAAVVGVGMYGLMWR